MVSPDEARTALVARRRGGRMKRMLTVLTAAVVVLAAVVLAIAVAGAPRTGATTALCHMTTLSIEAPPVVKARKTVTVVGAEAVPPTHAVKATLQYRLASKKAWRNGGSENLTNGAYALKWKAPAKKGLYELRVRVTRQSTANASEIVTVKVR
jgi:hypothetical protein